VVVFTGRPSSALPAASSAGGGWPACPPCQGVLRALALSAPGPGCPAPLPRFRRLPCRFRPWHGPLGPGSANIDHVVLSGRPMAPHRRQGDRRRDFPHRRAATVFSSRRTAPSACNHGWGKGKTYPARASLSGLTGLTGWPVWVLPDVTEAGPAGIAKRAPSAPTGRSAPVSEVRSGALDECLTGWQPPAEPGGCRRALALPDSPAVAALAPPTPRGRAGDFNGLTATDLDHDVSQHARRAACCAEATTFGPIHAGLSALGCVMEATQPESVYEVIEGAGPNEVPGRPVPGRLAPGRPGVGRKG